MSESKKYSLEELKKMADPCMNMENMFILNGEEVRFIVEAFADVEKRLFEHDKRIADQKSRLKGLISTEISSTHGEGPITAQRLRDILDAIVDAL